MLDKPKLGIDCDGTLCKTTDYLLSLLNYKNDTDYEVRDLTKWPMERNFQIDKKELHELYNYLNDTGMTQWLPLMDNRIPGYLRDLQRWYDLEIVTGRPEKAATMTKLWMETHNMPDVPVKSVGRDQIPQKLDMGYDVIVDDCPKLYDKAAFHPTKKLVVHAAPWNKPHWAIPHNAIRLDNWELIYENLRMYGQQNGE